MIDTIIVIGAGVSGLSTSILLLEAGFEVEILAKEFSPQTTSDKAGAVLHPVLAEPKDKVIQWTRETDAFMRDHILKDDESGSTLIDLVEFFSTKSMPWWRSAVLDPSFDHVQIISVQVGLRPGRDRIRVEAEKVGSKTVVHNYGHGGSGFTVSWGCAKEVVRIVKGIT